MSDMNPRMGQQMGQQMGRQMNPQMGSRPNSQIGQGVLNVGSSPVEKNLSIFNPKDFAILFQQIKTNPEMTVREFFSKMGLDVDGPVAQITQFLEKGVENASPLGAMKNISAAAGGGTPLSPAGQQPVMPGRKPMVQPPRQPTAGGLQGLLNKMGGQK